MEQRTVEQQRIDKLTELLNDIVSDDKLYEVCPYCKGPGADEKRCPMKKAYDYLWETT